ncbi:hypothetical protein JCM8547_006609 [Rhodosporidiobolus lusitaniae]
MQLLPRPSLSRRSTASYADLVFSCPASNSDSGDPRDVWQNEDRAKDASWSSSVSAVYASVSSASVQSAASALVAVVEAGEGSETETATVSQRARVRRDEGTSPGKRTQGGGCTASVEELTGMGQGWFEGAVGLDFGVYGCNLTDSTGSSSITWHSAYATTDDYSAILCVWTSLDQDLTYTASIVNSPVGTTGHGAIWLGTAGFRYSENGAATGLFTATGPQMSTVSAPPSSLFATATDAGSTTAASSSTSADSPSSSSAATSSTSDSSSTFPFSGTTWLWLALLSLGQSWADDVENQDFPPRQETTDPATGLTTIVEYRLNEQGQKVKVTRKVKRTLVKTAVNHVVAERMGWAKFGQEKGAAPGPHSATTTVGENVRLKIQAGGIKADEPEEDPNAAMRAKLQDKKVTCRYCGGDHFTARCPYKDTLGAALGESGGADGDAPPSDLPPSDDPSAARAAGGKYVPPSMRAGAGGRGAGETMNSGRAEFPTLRVTNLSEDASDNDMWELFGRFANRGRISRIYVGKDQETGLCKGFGFVSFEDKQDAETALAKVHGLPYDHLILQVQWSVPKGDKEGGGRRD